MVGVGGMALAAQEMSRVQRELRGHIEDSRARRESRLARFQGSQIRDYWTAPARVDFDCQFLCAECGFLADEERGPCPACREREWVDLGHEATALALMDREQHERLRVPWWVSLGLAAALVAGLAAASLATGDVRVALIGAMAATLLFFVLRRPAAVLLLRLTRQRPSRWRLPVPLPDPGRQPDEVLTGLPEFVDQELLAPFTGWQCLAYQICILFDAPRDARPPEWVLHEVRGVDFRIDGQRIPGDRILLRTPLQPVTDEQLRSCGLDLNRFLRERGLFATDGEYTLFESRIDTDQPLKVSLRPEPQAVLVEQQI